MRTIDEIRAELARLEEFYEAYQHDNELTGGSPIVIRNAAMRQALMWALEYDGTLSPSSFVIPFLSYDPVSRRKWAEPVRRTTSEPDWFVKTAGQDGST